ncbi:MAG TPA: M56 family metallopeptidase [Phycisphaerae bacterium]|nr:M56 family metallopeptidase [Phycisphaerae bacterium]HRW52102.1 M56 family metallopeptidase [Phycisphaerae bacterium]
MTDFISWLTQTLWRNGLAVIPLALIVWAIVRWGVHRPATRHAMWLGALIWLVAAMLLPPMAIEGRVVAESECEPVAAQLAEAPARGPDAATRPGSITTRLARSDLVETPLACSDKPDQTPAAIADWRSELRSGSGCGESATIELNSTSDFVASSVLQDPTPPTTIVRPDGRATPLPIAAQSPVGQSSPLCTFADSEDESAPIPVCEPEAAIDVTPPALAEPPAVTPASSGRERFGVTMTPVVEVAVEKCETGVSSVGVREWVAGLARVRDSVGELPTIPPAIWFGVALLLVAFKLIACIRFCLRLRHARPASQSVQRMVRACASSMDLKCPPETRFVDDRISPMVVCGWRPKLVLPTALWSELDPAGRRAVIMHELAHLRRWDHLTHWFDCLIGVLYWWHPVVWWVRLRLRDEAENACDAWVTWFNPKERRAYATALLKARSFISEQGRFSAAPAVGVMSPQATKFSRRLTMVMTSRVSPKAYSLGVFAMPVLFLAAWISMPASIAACPPEEAEEVQPVQLIRVGAPGDIEEATATIVLERGDHRIESGEIILEDPMGRQRVRLAPAVATETVVLTVAGDDAPHVVSHGIAEAPDHGHGHAHSADERLDRLERQMAELSEKLSVLIEQRHVGEIHVAPAMPAMPTAPRMRGARTGAAGGGRFSAPSAFSIGAPANVIVNRTYQLPEAKLKALTRLMSRSDVPTRIQSVPGGILVMAPEADQAKFAAFVEMITGKGMDDAQSYKLPQGKLEALTELMALDDVPVLVHPGDEEIGVQGGALIQRTFRDFLTLLGPRGTAAATGGAYEVAPSSDIARGDYAEAASLYERVARGERKAEATQWSKAQKELQRARIAELRARAAQLESAAEHYSDMADQVQDKIDQIMDAVDDVTNDNQRADLEARLRELAEVLEQTRRQEEVATMQADELEANADTLEDAEDA